MKPTIATIINLSAILACLTLVAQETPRPAGRGLADRFKQLDKNGDGTLSADEFSAMPASKLMPDLFQRLDRDGSGTLSLEEFRGAAELRKRASGAKSGGTLEPQSPGPKLAAPVVALGTPEEIRSYQSAADYSHQHAGLVLLIMKDGKLVFEQHVEGSGPERAYQIASGTKSFWGPAAMAAIADGLFTLDEKVADTLTEWRDDPRKSRIIVRHLLSFSSGLEAPRRLWSQTDLDKGRFALAQPSVGEPGTKFSYSEVHLYAFAEVFKRKLAAKQPAGKPERPFDYLDRKVFQPIGLQVARWKKEANGDPAMGDGAVLTARVWAKYGELLRQRGVWNGQSVLPAGLLTTCFQSSAANQAYGLTFWLNKATTDPGATLADTAGHGRGRSSDRVSAEGICPGHLPDLVMAAGAGQQRLLILPSEKMVIVRFANENMPKAVMRGDYGKLDLNFRDEEFFARLFGWEQPSLRDKPVTPPTTPDAKKEKP